MTMETKRLTIEVKDADQGLVVAKFAQLGVIDLDGDVTTPGAFETGAKVGVSPYGHSSIWGDAPAGKGVIRDDGEWAYADLQFNLKTTAGREAFETVKFMSDQQEWSYGFDVVESESGEMDGQPVRFLKRLKVFEVSPVLRGAGIGTATVSAKDADGATFAEDGERALAALTTFINRSKALAALRAKDGRALSQANRDRINRLADGMRDALKATEDLATDPDQLDQAGVDALWAQRARLERSDFNYA